MKKLIKFLYDLFPFKKHLFLFLKIFCIPKHSLYQHLYFRGIFKVKTNNSHFIIKHYGYELENEIFWAGLTGNWEKESIKLWIKLCKYSEVVFDIGSNTGIYALIAKTINPNSKVYAFEPVKRIFIKLQKNISLNNFDIFPIEKAVSNSDGIATIYDPQIEHIYSVTVNKNFLSPDSKVLETEIEIITLDSFIKQNNINKIDLIKIDVETHEPEVLEGFSEYLSQFKPAILVEILTNEVGNKVESLVEGLGYLYFNIDERGSIRQVGNITKSDYYNYLLCNPDIASKIGLINKVGINTN